MKIAVTYENNQIFQHLGHTKQFKIYNIEENKIISDSIIDTKGEGHGALANFLKSHEINTLICGGIGAGAKTALSNVGITIYGGVTGDVDEAVNNFLAGTLSYNPNIQCNHHHNEEHSCGSGTHSCH